MRSGGRRPKPAWPLGAPRRLRLSPLHCSNNMLLPQPGCAAGTALAGTVHTLMEAQAGLAFRQPPPAAALPTAL